jgi:hypothetical protein
MLKLGFTVGLYKVPTCLLTHEQLDYYVDWVCSEWTTITSQQWLSLSWRWKITNSNCMNDVHLLTLLQLTMQDTDARSERFLAQPARVTGFFSSFTPNTVLYLAGRLINISFAIQFLACHDMGMTDSCGCWALQGAANEGRLTCLMCPWLEPQSLSINARLVYWLHASAFKRSEGGQRACLMSLPDLVNSTDYDDFIDTFAECKARRKRI